jgi:serine protease Do
VSQQRIGSKVPIEYVRDGSTKHAEIEIGELPSGEEKERGKLGLTLQTLDAPLARALGLDPDMRGAVIAQVSPGSPAERAGLEPGEIILQVDRQQVTSADEVVAKLRGATDRPHLLRVLGPKGMRFVTLEP